jgi:hypothetical protein
MAHELSANGRQGEGELDKTLLVHCFTMPQAALLRLLQSTQPHARPKVHCC